MEILKKIEEKAKELGIPEFGIVKPEPVPFIERYKKILERKDMGDLFYLKKIEERENPEKIFSGLKSIIAFLFPYPFDKSEALKIEKYKVAQFSYGLDYHKKIKEKLKIISKEIKGRCKILCDTSPFLEKPYGAKAGLGFLGKNTLLINEKFGSAINLGFILTEIDLPEKTKVIKKSCGNCNKCIEVCPTQALSEQYILDPKMCISYLTMEAKEIPEEPRERWGYIYGCDICQAVCPYNYNLKKYPDDEKSEYKRISKERLEKNLKIVDNEVIDFYIKQEKIFPLNLELKNNIFKIIKKEKNVLYFDGRNFLNLNEKKNEELKNFFSKIQIIKKNKPFEIYIN